MTGQIAPRALAAKVGQPLRKLRHWRQTEGGQSLVETALVLPILLVLLFGLVDFGRAFYTWLVVTNSAREGARVGSVQGTSGEINTRINDTLGSLNSSDLTITLTNVQGTRGTPVEVDLSYDFDYATPIGNLVALLGGSLSEPTITAHAEMRLE